MDQFTAPTASGSYNTGISLGPSLSQRQYQQGLNRFSQIGQAPLSRPIGTAFGNYGHPQLNSAPGMPGGMFNQARQAMGTTAGNQASNAFSNMVNQGQSELAANQTQAQSQTGNAMQGALSNIYSGLLNRGSALNEGQLSNLLNQSGMRYGLAGNLLGIGMNQLGQVVNPLMNGLFSGIGNLGGSLGSMLGSVGNIGSAGGFNPLAFGQQQPIDLSGLTQSDPLAALYAAGGE